MAFRSRDKVGRKGPREGWRWGAGAASGACAERGEAGASEVGGGGAVCAAREKGPGGLVGWARKRGGVGPGREKRCKGRPG